MSVAYGKDQRLLELASIAAFVLLSAWGLWRLGAATLVYFPLVLLAAAPAGWLAADLLSGLAHWAFDSFGSVGTPLIGESFIRPFRAHHADPQEMTRHDFVETHGASCFAALPLLAAASLLSLDSRAGILWQALLLFTALGALATNQCHKWAHMDEEQTPRLIAWAQRHRLVLPREHHRLHHMPPFDTHFCMSSGWLNAPFNALLQRWR
ncbi:MAG: fatty acid desaturase CarF family protein [Burkholderiales bacterium]